jgi:hypothetical protein
MVLEFIILKRRCQSPVKRKIKKNTGLAYRNDERENQAIGQGWARLEGRATFDETVSDGASRA